MVSLVVLIFLGFTLNLVCTVLYVHFYLFIHQYGRLLFIFLEFFIQLNNITACLISFLSSGHDEVLLARKAI